MDNDNNIEPKPDKPHKPIHIGALVIIIIIVFTLFKVNLNKAVNSTQFENNITYINEQANIAWDKYVVRPALYIWNNLFSDWLTKEISAIRSGDAFKPHGHDVDESTFNKVVQPNKIEQYFGNVSPDNVNKLSSPSGK